MMVIILTTTILGLWECLHTNIHLKEQRKKIGKIIIRTEREWIAMNVLRLRFKFLIIRTTIDGLCLYLQLGLIE
jgi:hypothetical protein